MKRPLKLLATAGLLLLCHFFGNAQSAFTPSQAHEDYWTYRNRFRTQFVKVGTDPGNSIPLSDRWDNIQSADEDNLGNKFCITPAGKIGSGDALSFMGWYMTMLATEYKLLTDAGQSTQATLNEIYYVIEAINRIDKNGELFFGLTSSTNGFLTRDDFTANSSTPWLAQQNTQMVGADNFGNMKRLPDGSCEVKDDVTDGTDPNGNIYSQDHIINIMLGFVFIRKFVPNVFVQPTTADRGFNIHSEMQQITRRMFNSITAEKTLTFFDAPCNIESVPGYNVTQTFNWEIFNPLTNQPIGFEKGGVLWPLCGPLAHATKKILDTEEFFIDGIAIKRDHDQPFCFYTRMDKRLSISNSMNIFNTLPDAGNLLSLTWHDKYEDLTSNESILNNANLFMGLGVILNTWSDFNMNKLATDFNLPVYELLTGVLHNKTSIIQDREFWEDMLGKVPRLHNPNRGYEFIEWAHTTSTTHINRTRTDESKGFYNGLDYMLLYNLYKIFYNDQVPFKEESCDCSKEQVFTFHIDNPGGGWDESYTWMGNAVEPSDFSTSTPFVVTKYHPDYFEKNIPTYEYFSKHNYNIHGAGEVILKTDAIACNARILSIYDGGELIVGGTGTGELSVLYVRKGAKIDLSDGQLTIKQNSRVIIEEGGTLIINAGSQILLDGTNAVLEIRGSLEIVNGATFQTTGDGYVLFNIKNPPFADPLGYNIKACPTCKMVFEIPVGNPKTKKLVIAKGTYIYPQDQMELFKVENVKVHFGGDKAGIKLAGKFHLVNGEFIGTGPGTGGDGITVYYLTHTNYITHNKFANLNRALTFMNYQMMPDLKIRYNNFEYCSVPITLDHQSAHIAGNSFEECGGILAGTTMDLQVPLHAGLYNSELRIELNKFKNSMGGSFMGKFNSPVTINGNSHYYTTTPTATATNGNRIGYVTDKISTTFSCNYFENYNETVTAYTDGEINLSSLRFSSIVTKTAAPIYGGHNVFKNNLKSLHVYDIYDDTKTVSFFLEDGFNSFYLLPNATWSSLVIDRPNNYPSINFTLNGNNIEINNNYWSPVLPTNAYQAGWPANVIEKNMTTHQGYRSFNFRIDEFFDPHYVVGTMASPTSTCPVSTWSDPITDPINFNPTSVPEFTIATADAEVVYIDRPFDLDELDIDNPVSTVTAGVYSGQNFGIAFNTAVGGLTEPTLDEEQNTVYTPYSPGLLNMADLLVNTAWAATKEELEIFNYGYSKYLGCLEKALTLNVFEGNTQIETNQLNAALSVFTAIETYNAQFELTQPTRYYDKRIAIGIDKTHVYRMFNQYANALTTLNTLSSFASATDAMPINYLICHTDNEKKLFNSEINWLEFESAVFNCTSVFGNNNQFGFTTDSTFWQDTLTWDSTNQLGLTFTMAPNPATTQITVDIALNVAGVVKVAIFDTYGIKVVNDISLGSLSTGNHQTTVPLTGLTPGVYAMVVYLDDVPYSQNFVKLE